MLRQTDQIPDFDERGNLPPGIYRLTYEELKNRFCKPHSMKRKQLMDCLHQCLLMYKDYAAEIYIDGSFITRKLAPGDIDMIIVWREGYQLEENFILFQNSVKGKLQIRTRMENMPFSGITDYLEFFQQTKEEDDENGVKHPKGIILLETI
jgi:hypothetical protein